MAPNASPKITLVGGGRLSRAIAKILEPRPVEVHIYARSPEDRTSLQKEFSQVTINDNFEAAVHQASVVFLAVPADQLLEVSERYGDWATGDQIVMTAVRGVGPRFELPHEMIRAKTCVRKIGILGGPIYATELETNRQINAVLASRFPECIETIRHITAGTTIAIHASRDIVGVSIAGAISNVSSIAAGMSDALDFGDTARGVLMAHGLVDAKKLGVALGGLESTFGGLTGVGELIPRNVHTMDRHVEVGKKLAQGHTVEAALAEVGGHVEGVTTAREAVAKAQTLDLKLPLVEAVARVITEDISAQEALEAVLHLRLDLDTHQAVRT